MKILRKSSDHHNKISRVNPIRTESENEKIHSDSVMPTCLTSSLLSIDINSFTIRDGEEKKKESIIDKLLSNSHKIKKANSIDMRNEITVIFSFLILLRYFSLSFIRPPYKWC